jgi:hypothetical protein
MGASFSRKSVESEPLIAPTPDSPPEPTSRFQKAIDVLAALKANKLPSQDQLNAFLQSLLRANLLDVGGVAGHGPISDDVKKVVQDVKELFEAVLQIGMEKNGESSVDILCVNVVLTPLQMIIGYRTCYSSAPRSKLSLFVLMPMSEKPKTGPH